MTEPFDASAGSSRKYRGHVNKTFMIFSCILFLIIFLVAAVAYTISARQINRSFIEQQLAIASETMRLRLATTVNSELALVLKMADTQIIQQYFVNPGDPELEALANIEFTTYQEHFKDNLVFWINDVDKLFYSTGNEPYLLDPDDPENYWYDLTLYRTEKHNLNINYNPDLHEINLWVNVPVFVETDEGTRKPVGMLGTGINLTGFSNFVATAYSEFDKNITPYMFNKYHEITSAMDYGLVHNKVRLEDHLGNAGAKLIEIADMLSDAESQSVIYGNNMYMVSSIPAMEWYLAVSYPLPGFLALNQSMNMVFFGMLFLIFLMFIIMNVFIPRLENVLAEKDILLEANRKAGVALKAKSDFLAKMSHEIRTPMNAIIGMAELALRGNVPPAERDHIYTIRQSGVNLLSIINDILEFSKIESGKLEIIPADYFFASLINDVISIIRMRVIDSQIDFIVNIDSNIPKVLSGDETRIRQILLNILVNAVKFTEKGFVSLVVTAESGKNAEGEDTVSLVIQVTDSGRGIKTEDIGKLFGDFVQIDLANNIGIEGTGLGLAITYSLVKAMGGDISVASEYGKGSTFTVTLPQEIRESEKLAVVDKPEKKRVLVYKLREIFANSIAYALKNLGVEYKLVSSDAEFREEVSTNNYSFIFVASPLYENLQEICRRLESEITIVLLAGFGETIADNNLNVLSMPVYSVSVANVLNGVTASSNFRADMEAVVRFIAPGARVLVVDDIATNLKVAEGLLAPYSLNVDTCLSGAEAIEIVKLRSKQREDYDIVFMDHMMPEMDGIEATAAIRAWENEQGKKGKPEFVRIPIVALTANAVSGMKEMFLEKGFSDFLAKPIDISKLDEILDHWIPKEKREKGKTNEELKMKNEKWEKDTAHSSSLTIPGVDVQRGIAMTGGTLEMYRQVLALFCKDAEKRLPFFRAVPDAGNLPMFVTQVHALKSASASIGAAQISSMAAELEAASRAADLALIQDKLPVFVRYLTELVKNISAVLEKNSIPQSPVPSPQFPLPTSNSLFIDLSVALKSQNAAEIDRVMDELEQAPLDAKTKEILERISDAVLMGEFEGACEQIDAFLGK